QHYFNHDSQPFWVGQVQQARAERQWQFKVMIPNLEGNSALFLSRAFLLPAREKNGQLAARPESLPIITTSAQPLPWNFPQSCLLPWPWL
ncbi:MAG: hypothetical protein KKH22_06975, partial [Proteobacteria bacterium]|nr:hypothetical protein [Pseudomonadota bacterium]